MPDRPVPLRTSDHHTAWVNGEVLRRAENTATALAEHGATRVLTHDASEYADYLVVPKVDVLQAAVLVPSSVEGKEIAARLALRIGSRIITDAVGFEAGEERRALRAPGRWSTVRVVAARPVQTAARRPRT